MMPLVPEQQQVMPIQKQVTYQNVAVQINPTPDGGAVLAFVVQSAGKVLMFPLDSQSRKKIGEALLAPSIEVPRPMPNGGASRRHH